MTTPASDRELFDILRRLDDVRKAGASLLADELMLLSEAYIAGLFEDDDRSSIAHMLRKQAIAKGHPIAMVAEAVELMEEAGGEETPEAMALIREAADLGEAESRFNMAMIALSNAESTPEDIEKALESLYGSAASGFPGALFQLALMHKFGKFVKEDIAKAAYYELAALDAGSPQAQQAIGSLFTGDMIGSDGTVDRKKVVGLACDAGCAAALFDAFCASLEKNAEANEQQSFDLLKRSAEAEYIPAMTALSDFVDTGSYPMSARQLLERGAEAHYPPAMSSLGRMLFAENEKERGRQLIEAALNFGNADAMVFIAELSRRGTLPDPTEGVRSDLYTLLSRRLMQKVD